METLLTHLSGLASNLITDVTKPLSHKRYFVAQKSCDDIYHRVSLGGDLCSYVMYKTWCPVQVMTSIFGTWTVWCHIYWLMGVCCTNTKLYRLIQSHFQLTSFFSRTGFPFLSHKLQPKITQITFSFNYQHVILLLLWCYWNVFRWNDKIGHYLPFQL